MFRVGDGFCEGWGDWVGAGLGVFEGRLVGVGVDSGGVVLVGVGVG